MLTSLTNRQTVEQCLTAGAAGYIRKDTPKEAILPNWLPFSRTTWRRTERPCPTILPTSPRAGRPAISEVRYSLPEMLREIEIERRESSFAMETLDQVEIQKLFASRRRHARVKK